MVIPAELPRILFQLYHLEGQACADPLALIPDLSPHNCRTPSWLLPTLGTTTSAQQLFLADFPAPVDDPTDPNWRRTPYDYNVFITFSTANKKDAQDLLHKCIETARNGKTVVLALACTNGFHILKNYTSSHPDTHLFSFNFLQLPDKALPV